MIRRVKKIFTKSIRHRAGKAKKEAKASIIATDRPVRRPQRQVCSPWRNFSRGPTLVRWKQRQTSLFVKLVIRIFWLFVHRLLSAVPVGEFGTECEIRPVGTLSLYLLSLILFSRRCILSVSFETADEEFISHIRVRRLTLRVEFLAGMTLRAFGSAPRAPVRGKPRAHEIGGKRHRYYRGR